MAVNRPRPAIRKRPNQNAHGRSAVKPEMLGGPTIGPDDEEYGPGIDDNEDVAHVHVVVRRPRGSAPSIEVRGSAPPIPAKGSNTAAPSKTSTFALPRGKKAKGARHGAR